MDQIGFILVLAVVCLMLPRRWLIALSVVSVLVADTPLVPRQSIYLARFVPSGILALRTLAQLIRTNVPLAASNMMIKAWSPFYLLALISVLYSIHPGISLQRVISAIFVLIGFGLGFPVLFPRIRDSRALVGQVAAILGGAVLYSLLFHSGEESRAVAVMYERASGIFVNPNTLGLLAMQTAFLVVYLWQRERRQLRRILLALALAGVLTAVVVSGSRASALGLLIGALVWVRIQARLAGRTLPRLVRVAIWIPLLALLTETVLPGSLTALFRTEISSRTVLWQRAWELAQPNLIFGVGFAASDSVFVEDTFYLRAIGVYVAGPHSSVMRLLVDMGLAGVLLTVGAFFAILRHAWKQLPYLEDRNLGLALFATIAASLTNSVFESWLFGFGSSSTVPFWLCLAMLAYEADRAKYLGARTRQRQGSSPSPVPIPRPLPVALPDPR